MREPEVDQTRYPYGDLRIGDNSYVTHIPTLSKVIDIPMPLALVLRVGVRLNALHYAGEKEALLRTTLNIKPLIVDEADAAKVLGLISVDEYRDLLVKLEA